MIILIAILAVISGLAYWLGGQGDGGRQAHPTWPKWLFDRTMRHAICPLSASLVITILSHFHWSLLICYPIAFAATTCYWNFLSPHADKTWWNWTLHGLGIGLSFLPYAHYTHQYLFVSLYAISLGATMTIWSAIISNDFLEENGRGELIVWCIPAVLSILSRFIH